MVFLHGAVGTIDFWETALPAEIRTKKWYSLSLPGHHPAQVPAEFSRKDVTADWLNRLVGAAIDQLCTQPAVIVGWSTGGFAALNLAVSRHPKVASVVSLFGFANGIWHGEAGWLQWLARRSLLGPWLSRQIVRRLQKSRWLYGDLLRRFTAGGRTPMPPDVLDEMQRECAQHDPRALIELFAGIREINLVPELSRIDVPVCVVGGAADPIIPAEYTREIAQSIRGAQLELLPEVGHMFSVECPEEVERILVAWLAEFGGGC